MIVKMLTHMHMVMYTWWCWHICKGEVGVETDQLDEETEAKQVTVSDWTLALSRPVCPVSGSSESAGVGLRPNVGSLCDWMHGGCIRSR